MAKKTNQVPFADQVAAVEAVKVVEATASIQASFATRAQYELDTNPGNDNIQKTLTKVAKRMTTDGVVRSLIVGNEAQTGFINVQEVKHKRRNVYALDKTADLLYGATTGHLKNAINIAILKSMVALKGMTIDFTMAVAKACASDKVAVSNNLKALLTRHTVSESTAPTQASSTMTALEDLGVVKNTGTRAAPVWIFTDTALSQRLQEVVA